MIQSFYSEDGLTCGVFSLQRLFHVPEGRVSSAVNEASKLCMLYLWPWAHVSLDDLGSGLGLRTKRVKRPLCGESLGFDFFVDIWILLLAVAVAIPVG